MSNRWLKGRKIPGSGRKKGTPNKIKGKRKAELLAEVRKTGEAPLDFLLRVMRNRRQPLETRLIAAKAAAPYVHPALKAVEFTGTMLHGISGELQAFIAGNATASRSFLGFDGEDQDAQAAPDIGSIPHH